MNYSFGYFKYTKNPNKLIVEVDQEIQNYYRNLIPIKTNRQKYPAHITVMRGENPNHFINIINNQIIYFWYYGFIHENEKYFWINVHCPKLKDIRQLIGLNPEHTLSKPPDSSNCFHITIANKKGLNEI